MMSLSENLKVLRKQKGLSQEQLAEQLNVSRQAVSKWESNNGMPEMDSLIILSEIFECTIDDLLKKDLTDHDPTVKQIYEKHYDDECLKLFDIFVEHQTYLLKK